MKRIYLFAISLGIVFITIVGLILVVPKGHFEWEIEIGDSLSYEVRTWGNDDSGYLAGIPFEEIMLLNETFVEANISSLPPVNWITSAEFFLTTVVQVSKVNCSFVNETTLPSRANDIVTEMISVCLLPIGDWSVLDSFYADEIAPWEPGQEYYASRLLGEQFVFEWISYGDYDSREEWTGFIALENGVPNKIMWHYNHSMSDIYIELSLVDS